MNTDRNRLLLATSVLSVVLLAAVATGCGATGRDDDLEVSESDSALIAEIPFSSGGTLRFYEPEPGVLVEVEQGPSAAPRERVPGEEHMNAADRYTLLTGQRAPERLVAAAAAVEDVTPPTTSGSVEKDLSAEDISRPGPREDFLRLYCQKTDRFYWRLGYSQESAHSANRANYYAWGVNAIQGPTHFRWRVEGFNGSGPTIDAYLPQGWYAGAVTKVGGAGVLISSFAMPGEDGALFDHCVNFHY